ncbi:uncharacterized protein YndB with AHSA1/START domain [Mesorhizobium sp. J18]|uniref:SRPBCC family protein n=1 Tax=Mesorhizobium sp. J18 TaxID=935263 RepID=UPI00119B9BA8|nr:SRPBCC family protein [Mesorhizobium sp. J18]TWG91351.1 uncharacterized protein YndB with AHSA1/START domain [Mesorhizobium sp. J18]
MTTIDNNAYGVQTASDTVRVERLLPGPIERVWAYLTDSEKRKKWLAGGEMELRAGGRVNLFFHHSEITFEPTPERFKFMEKGIHSQCEVTEFDPPRLLAMTWPDDGHASEVMFELFPEGDKVLLVLTHRKLPGKAEMANVSSGWHAHLAVLAALLEGREASGFWSSVIRLEDEYKKRFGAE